MGWLKSTHAFLNAVNSFGLLVNIERNSMRKLEQITGFMLEILIINLIVKISQVRFRIYNTPYINNLIFTVLSFVSKYTFNEK